MISFNMSGTLEVLTKIGIVEKLYAERFEKGCAKAGRYILKESQKIVPYETGALHDSGETYNAGGSGWRADQVVSYGAGLKAKKGFDYSLLQHEIKWYAHTPPTRYKYLEEPIRTNKHKVLSIIQKTMISG